MRTSFLRAAGLLVCAWLAMGAGEAGAAEKTRVDLVRDGQARAVIVVPAETMQPNAKDARKLKYPASRAEQDRQRLRESVNDLAAYLEKMSGGKISIVNEPPATPERIAILIGRFAEAKFGKPAKPFMYEQGFRIVVTPDAIGLLGESDLATSYAICEVLDRLGCRWFMPGDMGEYVPKTATVSLEEMDYSGHPYTYYRGIWYADEAYKRRNRLGGLLLSAGHALEMYITKAEREQHPEWVATVDGKPHPHRLKWSSPGLAEAIADKIIARHETNPQPTYSLSPDDGVGYDNSPGDRALDAGDFDPSMQGMSLADRLTWFCNRIAARVTAKYPEVRFGVLSYVPYSRPPVREKLHPSIVPQIAPITFSRAHPMTDDGEPNNKDLRYIVERWGKQVPATSYYFYGWFLAELSGPNPMIRKWSIDIPLVYQKGACRYWQPETVPNFESSMHALYLGIRMAWDPGQKPGQIIADLSAKLYGNMAREMSAYWDYIDECWYGVPEYSGAGFGHLRRWTPERLGRSRVLLNAAIAAARTDQEKALVELYDQSLRLFEQFMQLRRDLAEGRFAELTPRSKAYLDAMAVAKDKYKPQSTFGGVPWTKNPAGMNGVYFHAFYEDTYADAARIAGECRILTPTLRPWRWITDNEKSGESRGYAKPEFDDRGWKTTDVAVETWSALGLHNYMGSVWYRQNVELKEIPRGKRICLWIGSTDGSVKVWVNGRPAKYLKPKLDAQKKPTGEFEPADEASGYCKPFSFDVTEQVKPGANQVTILGTRVFLNESGTGGLLAAPVIYAEK